MKKCVFLVGLLLGVIPAIAAAGPFEVLDSSLTSSIASATTMLQTTAILWLSSFVLIQFLITNIGLLKSGADMEAIIGKFMGSMLWFGFCFYVMKNGANFLGGTGRDFLDKAGVIAGAASFDAGNIVAQGAALAGNLLANINKSASITNLFTPAIVGGLVGVVILGTAALIAFKVFLLKIELMLVIMMSPLSFSFLGLNALKDQGIAPFKALISLMYRTIFLALILATMDGVSDNLVQVIGSITEESVNGIWSVLFSAVLAYALLGFLAFKSDSLAANLASGSTNFGTADVASAAAIGSAVGAAIGTGGANALGATKGAPQGMGAFLQNLAGAAGGGGGSISNASGHGAGPSGPAPSRGAAMSVGGAAAGGSPPIRAGGTAAPKSPQSGTSGAGTPQSGTSGAGTPQSGTSGAGTPQSGTSGAGTPQSGTSGAGTPQSGTPSVRATAPDSSEGSTANAGLDNSPAAGASLGESGVPKSAAGTSRGQTGFDSAKESAGPSRGAVPDSGATAAISGPASQLEQKVDKLLEGAGKGAPQPKSVRERLSDINRHVEQERAATHISISTHNSD